MTKPVTSYEITRQSGTVAGAQLDMDGVSLYKASMPYKEGDIVIYERIIRPKWWQFWKKPEKRLFKYKTVKVPTEIA